MTEKFDRDAFAEKIGVIEQKEISAEAMGVIDSLIEQNNVEQKKSAELEKKIADLQQVNQKLYLQVTARRTDEGNVDKQVEKGTKVLTFDEIIREAKGLKDGE